MGFYNSHLLAFCGLCMRDDAEVKKLSKDLENCWAQVADEDHYSGQQTQRIDALFERCRRLETIMDN
jgi:hypothetical protein